jgi:catechol 2,3-dioxygenase-like lactoylglutathione lyase family enzyme
MDRFTQLAAQRWWALSAQVAQRRLSRPTSYDPAVLSAAPLMAFIPVSDLPSARSFYGEVLGLEVEAENPCAVILNSDGTLLRLTHVENHLPQPFTIAGWEVPDIGATIDALVSRGVTFTRYDGVDQDERGIWTTAGGEQVAWFKDPDGNTLSLTTFTT